MWVVKNKNGELRLFTRENLKPRRANKDAPLEGNWFDGVDLGISIKDTLFPELKWEDEPLEVELVSKRFMNFWREKNKHIIENGE